MPNIVPFVISQHAEEAAFLWLLRDGAVRAPHYRLNDLENLDYRVEAHVDGLRIAGKAGWETCREALAIEEPGEVFAAAVLAYESAERERCDALHQVALHDPVLSRALVSAVGWLPWPRAEVVVKPLLREPSAGLRRLAIAGYAVHRRDPGPALLEAARDADPTLQARALRALGELGRKDQLQHLRSLFQVADRDCRCAALWSANVLGGDQASLVALESLVRELMEEVPAPAPDKPNSGAAVGSARLALLDLLLRRLNPEASRSWLLDLRTKPHYAREAVIGAGVLGDPADIPWLVNQMSVPNLSRAAGEALSMITGANIALLDLEGDRPEGFEAGPGENPDDADVDMDQEEHLPWPDPKLVGRWWYEHSSEYRPGLRHFLGSEITPESLNGALRTGWQRQRRAAALELAIRNPGHPLYEVRAPGFAQKRQLFG